jgi:AAA+ ATPase superfamily predicted ATPase
VFIDRVADLDDLESRWGMRPQLYLLWGRRRVGKSALIRQFAARHDAIIYQAVTGTITDQLSLLTRRIAAWRKDPLLAAAPLANWGQAFAYLENLGRARKASGEPLLVVFDEFQYLCASDDTVISRLQEFLEVVKHDDLPLFLIVSGSAISFFEERIVVGAVFGRRTAGGLLRPLSYRDAAMFFPDWSAADRVRAWAVLGGMPYYLEQFDPRRGLEWNIRERMLRRNQVLYNEADLLLREELRDAPTYQSVLAAVADGQTKNADIAARSGVAPNHLSTILTRMERLHLVERTVPFGEDPASSKRGLWTVLDNYLAFWFTFVRPNITELEAGRADAVWGDEIKPALDRFASKPAFERLCRDYVRSAIGRDPRLPARGDVGEWWGPYTSRNADGKLVTEQRQADVVVGAARQVTLVGECKWSDALVDIDALHQLRTAAAAVPGTNAATRLALFAREGFTDRVRAIAEQDGTLLLTAADLLAEPAAIATG